MNLLSWNCRGVGRPRTCHQLHSLVKFHSPDFIFLSETKNQQNKLDSIRRKIGMSNGFWVDPIGLSGGLGIMWNDVCRFEVISFCNFFIDVKVTCVETRKIWHLICIYLSPDDSTRYLQFQRLESHIGNLHSEVVVWGDFNDTLSPGEKRGGVVRERWKFARFQSFVDKCGVVDMGFKGYPFTWRNNRGGAEFIESRLDRVLISDSLYHILSDATVEHIDGVGSDHKAILFSTKRTTHKRKTPFRFDSRWTEHEEVRNLVRDQWQIGVPGSRLFNVWHKVKKCRGALRNWRVKQNLNSRRNIEVAKSEIGRLELEGREHHIDQIVHLENQIEGDWDREEVYWKQKSHMKWLQFGDRNSSFFHASTRARRRRNFISGVEDAGGTWVTAQEGLMNEFQGFFKSLYTSEASHREFTACNYISPRVSNSMNRSLLRPFTSEEIKAALFDMHPNTAPGYDGMTAGFFQSYWDIVGTDVCRAVRSFFYSGRMLGAINRTQIVLIPKVAIPTKVKDFRPISLCTIVYKVIAKLMAKRLKQFLPSIISLNQSAFVEGRQITDNVLIAHELTHYIRHKKSGNKGVAAFKLDMAKAYDRVEWDYLEAIMSRMGFHKQWIEWVMGCVKTVTFSITVNGEAGETFSPTRGIRQGCPLSPYLFLLCGEGFSAIIESFVRQKQMLGFRINCHCPKVSHLLFADDSVVYCQASEKDCKALRDILALYERESGQMVNKDKSSVLFSPNTPINIRSSLSAGVGIALEVRQAKYLGLPLFLGLSKKDLFEYIKVRTVNRLRSWKDITPNGAGREILLKAVVLPLASYAMSCFRLPKILMNQISAESAKFWWGSRNGERKIHWVSWEKLRRCKGEGGMGFRDMVAFNRALIAKQGWKLMSGESSLFKQIFKGRYFPHTSFLHAPVRAQSSWAWKSLAWARPLLEKGWRWQVVSGSEIRVWEDPWLPGKSSQMVSSSSCRVDSISKVSDLVISDSKTWNEELIRQVFCPSDVEKILSIPLSISHSRDRKIWGFSSNGFFSVKSAYNLEVEGARAANTEEAQPSNEAGLLRVWKNLWGLRIHPKIKIFGWKCFKEALATHSGLSRRKIIEDATCPICGLGEETTTHMLFRCPRAVEVWLISPFRFRANELSLFHNMLDWWSCIEDRVEQRALPKQALGLGLTLCWWVWRMRNDSIFNSVNWTPEIISSKALAYFYELSTVANVAPRQRSGLENLVAWKKPPVNIVKINVDAGISRANNRCGTGGIARDSLGDVIGICTRVHPFIQSPRVAEALAIRDGIQLGISLRIKHVIIESDAEAIIQVCSNPSVPPSDIATIVHDCVHLMSSFISCRFTFIKRNGNRAAHECASKARSIGMSGLWTTFLPPWGSSLSRM